MSVQVRPAWLLSVLVRVFTGKLGELERPSSLWGGAIQLARATDKTGKQKGEFLPDSPLQSGLHNSSCLEISELRILWSLNSGTYTMCQGQVSSHQSQIRGCMVGRPRFEASR